MSKGDKVKFTKEVKEKWESVLKDDETLNWMVRCSVCLSIDPCYTVFYIHKLYDSIVYYIPPFSFSFSITKDCTRNPIRPRSRSL